VHQLAETPDIRSQMARLIEQALERPQNTSNDIGGLFFFEQTCT
jgi:hypothetical protein